MLKATSIIREASWIDRDRVIVYPKLLVLFYLAVAALWIANTHGVANSTYQPLGPDFVKCWAASSLALSGHPADAYNKSRQWAAEKAAVNYKGEGYEIWDYPPTFLMLVWPFAFLTYNWSLLTWTVLTIAAYLVVLWFVAPNRHTLWIALSFPR